jgi:hypothetical protein
MSTQTTNIKHTELIAKLKEEHKTKSKSEIAQATQTVATQAQAIKTREVKDFVVTKTKAELDADSRKVVKERRAYMLSDIDSDKSLVFNATMYRTENNELALFTQQLANKLVLEYVQKLASMSKFDAQDIKNLLQTCGGAYCDKIRNALFAISLRTTATEVEKDINAVIATAQSKQKLCIFYNIIEDSRRAKYDFIKL